MEHALGIAWGTMDSIKGHVLGSRVATMLSKCVEAEHCKCSALVLPIFTAVAADTSRTSYAPRTLCCGTL